VHNPSIDKSGVEPLYTTVHGILNKFLFEKWTESQLNSKKPNNQLKVKSKFNNQMVANLSSNQSSKCLQTKCRWILTTDSRWWWTPTKWTWIQIRCSKWPWSRCSNSKCNSKCRWSTLTACQLTSVKCLQSSNRLTNSRSTSNYM